MEDDVSENSTITFSEETSDRELLLRCRDGDAVAFDLLADRYREPLLRHIAAVIWHERADAEDVLQEALLRVWLHARSWDERGTVKAWLFRIATNAALNHRRSVGRRREMPLEPQTTFADAEAEEDAHSERLRGDAAHEPDAETLRADERRRLRGLMDALSEEKREVLRLIVDEDHDIRQAAARLNVPEGTVKSRLFHARRQIARSWEQEQKGDEIFES